LCVLDRFHSQCVIVMDSQLVQRVSAAAKFPFKNSSESAGSRLSSLSISKRLASIVLALAIPLNLIVVAAVWRLSEAADEAQRAGLLYTARTAAAAVDAKIGQYCALGQALSRFPSLLDDNLAVFEAEARRAFASVPDATIVVADLNGQELLNTASRVGQPLPVRGAVAFKAQTQALEKGTPAVSGVYRGIVSGTWLLSVEIPVFKDGLPFRSLAIAVNTEAFSRLLNEQNLPEYWMAGMIDGGGTYIARAVPGDNGQAIGQLASESWRSAQNLDGVHDILTLEGVPVVKAIVRSRATGWSVGVAVQRSILRAAAWSTARWALILGGILSVLSLAFASAVAHTIAAPIGDLCSKAQALFHGSGSLPAPAGPPEVKDLWRALKQAADSRDQSEEALRDNEERLRRANEAADIGTFTVDVKADCIHYSPELAAMLGFPDVRNVKLEDAFARVHRDDVARARAMFEAGLSGADGGQIRGDFRFVRRGGEVRWLAWAGSVAFSDAAAGRVPVRVSGACVDITERKQAEKALRNSEERLRLSNEAGSIGTFTIDPATGTASYPAETAAILGFPEARGGMMDVFFKRVHRDDLAWVRERYEAALHSENGARLRLDFRYVRPGGEVRWISWAARAERRERQGARVPFRIIGACVDITERKRAEEALRTSEARFRGIFEHAGTGIAITDLKGRVRSCNPAFACILGYTADELSLLDFHGLVYAEDREANLAKITRLRAQEIPSFEIMSRYVAKDGRLVWVHKHVSLLKDDAGTPTHILALVTDVTGHKSSEERIKLLLREVNHRSKNMLTLVQAVARQTIAATPDDFLLRFGQRVQALAASQDLLTRNDWRGANLNELVCSQLAHFNDLIGTRIHLEGPPLLISASAAQAIGMAVHELATNAGKYGALSTPDGQVDIAWHVEDTNPHRTFVMSWTERQGPPIKPPESLGFGTTVIGTLAEMSLNAIVELDFPAQGARWYLRCQAREIEEVGNVSIAGVSGY